MDVLYYSNNCKHCKKLLDYLAKNGLIDKFNFMNIDRRAIDPYTQQITIMLDRGTKVTLPPNVTRVPTLIMVSQKHRTVIGEEIYNYLDPVVAKNTNKAVGENGEPSGFVLAPSSGGVNIVSETYTMYDASPEELLAKGNGQMRQMHNYTPAYETLPPQSAKNAGYEAAGVREFYNRSGGDDQNNLQSSPSAEENARMSKQLLPNNQFSPAGMAKQSQDGVYYRVGQVVVPELQRPPPHRHNKIGGDVTVESIQQQRNEDLQNSMPPIAQQLNNAVIPRELNVRPPGTFATNKSDFSGTNNSSQSSLPAYMPKLNPEDAREMLFGKRSDDRGKPVALSAPYLVNI